MWSTRVKRLTFHAARISDAFLRRHNSRRPFPLRRPSIFSSRRNANVSIIRPLPLFPRPLAQTYAFRTRMDRENFLSTRNVASVRQEEEIGSAHRFLEGNGAKEIGEIGIERGNK